MTDLDGEFFLALTAPYSPPSSPHHHHRAPPRPDHAARCRATINWTLPPPTLAHPPPTALEELDRPIYEPHGRWAWSHGLPIDHPKQLLSLQKGAQCTASIDSGTIDGKEIKYVSRRWRSSTQKDWYGFHSELALYGSEQYLRPLQGDVVPYIIGVHVLPEAVSITMEMPHSSFWIESSPSMPHVLKESVIAAFEKIHARGVLHGDPELRHMLIGADGRVTIIDFGMSRAIREHPSLGIERAEPEEFRLEMRKVKYKLDYMGARKKEGDKVDDYLRRVRRNRKISELWQRRAKGERVGPIPQYEEDPDEYELDPPVNAQDFQQDWITASDDSPTRVVVPGQTPRQVTNEVQALLAKLDEICSSSPCPSAQRHKPSCSSPGRGRPELEQGSTPSHPLPRSPRARDERHPALWHTHATRSKRRQPRRPADSPPQRHDDDLLPLSPGHIQGTSRRRDHIRHKQLRNTFISTLSSNPGTAPVFPSLVDDPQDPKGLKPEEYRKIQESRRQAMAQYSRAPRGILKRRRDDGDGDGQADAAVQARCKRLRFTEQGVLTSWRRRASYVDGRRSRAVVCTLAYKRLIAPGTRLESTDFTLPSLRTLSVLVGSLMPWTR